MGSKVLLGEIADLHYGKMPNKKLLGTGNYKAFSGYQYVDSYPEWNTPGKTLVVVARGVGGTGDVKFVEEPVFLTNLSIAVEIKDELIARYLYWRHFKEGFNWLRSGSAQPQITISDLGRAEIELPNYDTIQKSVTFFDTLQRKIELNTRSNDYLAEMLIALQKQVVETNATAEYRADGVFAIHIGKTPPRKQHEWFSFDHADNVIWMSIKDMGNAGAYLIDSSEYLTRQAVEKFNIRKCQPGSILLSFKLTIGRVGIVANEMVTNEAIACFASEDQRKLAYLYPLLLTYDYASMGSTSSIATAVNSKMVKAMPLRIPGENALDDYFNQAKPILDLLLSNTREIAALEQLRDTLLPKLMSGEIDASEVELPTQLNIQLERNK